MDTQTDRTLIKQIMTRYATLTAQQPVPGIETLLAFDDLHDQYLWLQVGWAGQRRVQGITLYSALVVRAWRWPDRGARYASGWQVGYLHNWITVRQ